MLQSGEEPEQRHEHARHVMSSGQVRSDGQSKRAARSGLNMTATHADRAEEALVERVRGGGGKGREKRQK